MKELISVLSNLGTIPPQYFPGFNFSYWMPLIDTLAISYTQNLPKQVLRTLELLEPLMRDTDFWVTLRGSVSAASQYMSWINDKLEEIDQLGENIDIVKLLPDLDEVCHFCIMCNNCNNTICVNYDCNVSFFFVDICV